MKRIKIELSKFESVDFLWSELIEDYGFEKAKNIVSQAKDLQKMNEKKYYYANNFFWNRRFSFNTNETIEEAKFYKLF